MQKIVFVSGIENPDRDEEGLKPKLEPVNDLLSKGWRVVSVNPQHVSVSIACSSYASERFLGGFLVVLELPEPPL